MSDREASEMAATEVLSRTLLGNHDALEPLRDLTRMDAEDVLWLCLQGEEHKAADLYLKRVVGKIPLRSSRADFAKALDRVALLLYLNGHSFANFVDSQAVYRRASTTLENPQSAALLREAFLSWYDPSQNYGFAKTANAILGGEDR